jgi:hypothetical protein
MIGVPPADTGAPAAPAAPTDPPLPAEVPALPEPGAPPAESIPPPAPLEPVAPPVDALLLPDPSELLHAHSATDATSGAIHSPDRRGRVALLCARLFLDSNDDDFMRHLFAASKDPLPRNASCGDVTQA